MITLILEVLKVALETFQDERRGRFRNEYDKLRKEYDEELSRDKSDRSDLALDGILLKCRDLAKRIIEEANVK